MKELESEIKRLAKTTEANRREFVKTEIQTCFVTLEKGRYELSLGDTHETEKELAIVEHGIQVIERFLPAVEDQIAGVQERFAELKESTQALRSELEKYPR